MNCRECQAQITDALARDGEPLPTRVAAHMDSCSTCREFRTKLQHLFHSIDAEVESLVNQPVSPSFLPVVRDRIGENRTAHRWASPAWSLLVATAALIIVFTSASKFYSSKSHRNFPRNSVASSPTLVEAVPPKPTAKVAPVHRGSRSRTSALSSSPEFSKVIVLPQEQKAFTRFVAEVPEHQQVVLALTRPTSLESVESVEIAPLQIATLEVKPLEGSEAE